MPRQPRSFAQRVLVSQLGVIVLVLALSATTSAWLGSRAVAETNATHALSTARTLAEDPQLRQEVTEASAQDRLDVEVLREGPVQAQAEQVRRRAQVEFVVVADIHGTRLSHPDPAEIGQHLSTSPDRALAGEEDVYQQTGTLGSTVRAKVPVYSSEDDGSVVGLVSVGISSSVQGADIRREILAAGLVAAAALGIGAAVSLALVRRLERATLGVGPEELADMARHQEAVLQGLDDGVLGFSPSGAVTLSNARARSMLGWAEQDGPVPEPIARGAHRAIDAAHAGDLSPVRGRHRVGDRILLITTVPVRRGAVEMGAVVTLQDETQILTMGRQLESVTAMAQALRTQRHEFANRLHTVLGLVGTGAGEEAGDYLRRILRSGPIAAPVEGIEALEDPYLRALLEAKGTLSAEAGVLLRVSPESLVLSPLAEPEDVTMILGNLIDNAVRAVVDAPRSTTAAKDLPEQLQGIVEVHLLSAGQDLHATVADSGPGLDAAADTGILFAEGVTGRPGAPEPAPADPGAGAQEPDEAHGHGIGLALCRRAARR
uniref:sensor histidine kinase n=1 Tax=Kocuria palustris TaxID=71999 RepID=UPI0028D2C9C4